MQVLLQTLLDTISSHHLALEPVVACKVLVLPLLLYLRDDTSKMSSGMQASATEYSGAS